MFSALGRGNRQNLEIKESSHLPYISFFVFLFFLLPFVPYSVIDMKGQVFLPEPLVQFIHHACSGMLCQEVCQLIIMNILSNERR